MVEIALVAYVVDGLWGEFGFVRHPVVVMGDIIGWYQKRFYRDSILRGAWLAIGLVVGAGLVGLGIEEVIGSWVERGEHPYLYALAVGVIASTTLASKMLYDSVYRVIEHPETIRYLVSRDTDGLTRTQIHRAAIETYAENLSDGVIAPLLYLIVFGLPGALAYKAINTLDSMVGYRNARYERFGKVSARLDDVANYIPARITAVLIGVLGTMHNRQEAKGADRLSWGARLRSIRRQAARHASPNAGYPIAAMGWAVCVRLGGPTRYEGVLKPKGWLGIGSRKITPTDVRRALALQGRLDMLIVTLLIVGAGW
jgi:adenosylcobinamide-phosphate synthase